MSRRVQAGLLAWAALWGVGCARGGGAGTAVASGGALTGYDVTYPAQLTLPVGSSADLFVASYAPGGAPAPVTTLRSTDPSVATVSGTTVTALSVGTAQITGGASQRALSFVTVVDAATVVPLGASPTLGVAPSWITLGLQQTLVLTVVEFDAGGRRMTPSVTWSSSNTRVAQVLADGTVQGGWPGTATVTATSTADAAITASAHVYVKSLSQMTNLTPCAEDPVAIVGGGYAYVALLAGGAGYDDRRPVYHACSGTVEYTSAGIWTSSAPTVATVDAAGHVAPVGCGRAIIRFAPTAESFVLDTNQTVVEVTPDWRGSWVCTETTSIPGRSCNQKASATIVAAATPPPWFLPAGHFSDAATNTDPARFGWYRSTQSQTMATLSGMTDAGFPACIPNQCFTPWVPAGDSVACSGSEVTYSDQGRTLRCVKQGYDEVCAPGGQECNAEPGAWDVSTCSGVRDCGTEVSDACFCISGQCSRCGPPGGLIGKTIQGTSPWAACCPGLSTRLDQWDETVCCAPTAAADYLCVPGEDPWCCTGQCGADGACH